MLLSRIGRTKSDKVKFTAVIETVVHLVAPYQNSVTHWNANPFSYFICKSQADNIGRLAILTETSQLRYHSIWDQSKLIFPPTKKN
jgi:hypothetical protein